MFSQHEIQVLLQEREFNITFLEDIDLMNDVRSDIMADTMKFNAVLFAGSIKMQNLSLKCETENEFHWKKSLY